MPNEFVVEGLDEMLASMDGLALTMQRVLIARALRAGAEPIEERIRELAPDDPDTPGSRIKENIDTNITEQTADGAIAIIGPSRKGFVAGFSEFGTAHQQQRPFIGPAFDETMERAIEIISETLGDGIEEALKKN